MDGTATGDESLPPATAAIYAQAMTRQLHTPCFIDTDTMPLSLRPEDPAATRPSPQAPRVRLLSLTRWPSSRPVTLAPLPRPSLPGRSSIVVVRSSRQNRGTRTTLAHTATHPLTTHARPSPPESTGKGKRRRRVLPIVPSPPNGKPRHLRATYTGTELSKREGPSPSPPCPLSPHHHQTGGGPGRTAQPTHPRVWERAHTQERRELQEGGCPVSSTERREEKKRRRGRHTWLILPECCASPEG